MLRRQRRRLPRARAGLLALGARHPHQLADILHPPRGPPPGSATRNAIALIAGPDSPPNTVDSTGRRDCTSIAIPCTVLIRQIASAPASATARVTATTSVTLGGSLTMTGSVLLRVTALVTAAACLGSCPKSIPPTATLGQLTLSS